MNSQWYSSKADQIRILLREARQDKFNHPLIKEMLDKKAQLRKEYYARISYNMFMYGKSPLKFDDIDF